MARLGNEQREFDVFADFAAQRFCGLSNQVGASEGQVVCFPTVLRQVIDFPRSGRLRFQFLPQDFEVANPHGELLERAREELYRAQCNCGYWHGAFGGIYLPHLRNAVYQHLIAADNLLDRDAGRADAWVEARAEDYNFDSRQEISLANISRDKLAQNRHALERLDNGSYGICEACGLPIGKFRLQAAPRATLCRSCKEKAERA